VVGQKIYLRSDLTRLFIKQSFKSEFLIRNDDETAYIEDIFLRDSVNGQIGELSYAKNIS
jgi:hypothetical protein